MRRLVFIFALLICSPAWADEIQPNSSYLFYTLALSENPTDWQMLEPAALHYDLRDTRLTDLIMERLLSLKDQQTEREDLIAHLLRLIGATRNARYFKILTEVRGDFPSLKLQRFFSAALKTIPDRDTEAFQRGQLNFNDIRTELTQHKTEWTKLAADRPKQLPPKGLSIEKVIALYGVPDYVNNLAIPLTRLGNYKLFYYGLGIIQLNYMDKDDRELSVEISMPETGNAALDYQGDNKPLAHAIASAHDKYFGYLVEGGKEKLRSDLALQKVLQAKLISLSKTDNDWGIKAIDAALRDLYLLNAADLDSTLDEMSKATEPDSDVDDLVQKWKRHRKNNTPESELTEVKKVYKRP